MRLVLPECRDKECDELVESPGMYCDEHDRSGNKQSEMVKNKRAFSNNPG